MLASAIAATLAWIYRELRMTQPCTRVLPPARSAQEAPWPVREANDLRARGHHAAALGDHAEAVRCFASAVALLRQARESRFEHETLPWLVTAFIQAGDFGRAADELRGAAAAGYGASFGLQLSLAHCNALLHHAQGWPARSLEVLLDIARGRPAGSWHAAVQMDAAWLLAEQGRADQARVMLGGLDRWMSEHPAAIATDARVSFAAGDYARAALAHRRYLDLPGVRPCAHFIELGEAYAAADAVRPATPPKVAALPALPSRL